MYYHTNSTGETNQIDWGQIKAIIIVSLLLIVAQHNKEPPKLDHIDEESDSTNELHLRGVLE